MLFFNKKKTLHNKSKKNTMDMENLPKHIAIIMDGNGRWAKKRGLPRMMGHKAGIESLREIIEFSSEIGIKALTLYAFSTENWKRPKKEVDALMHLLVEYLNNEVQELHRNNVKIRTIGNIMALPEKPKEAILNAIDLTKGNNGLIVNIGLNYGGREEIINSVKLIIDDQNKGIIEIDKLNEETFESYLYTAGIPSLDLLIRPSGELRISNFLLWQLAYAEFWFTDVLWPDFRKKHLIESIISYQTRERRYGGI